MGAFVGFVLEYPADGAKESLMMVNVRTVVFVAIFGSVLGLIGPLTLLNPKDDR